MGPAAPVAGAAPVVAFCVGFAFWTYVMVMVGIGRSLMRANTRCWISDELRCTAVRSGGCFSMNHFKHSRAVGGRLKVQPGKVCI